MSRLATARLRPGLAAACLSLMSLVLATGCQTTMKSEVKGKQRPKTVRCSLGEMKQVENGGFTIQQKCLFEDDLTVGDGSGEITLWSFDLSEEKALDECFPDYALLELDLQPTGDTLDERLAVENQWELGLEQIQSLEPGELATVEIDMMMRNGRPSPYTPSVIRSLLLEEPRGHLPMTYELNAIVSYAKLEIGCRK
jgi:hypothetical protein